MPFPGFKSLTANFTAVPNQYFDRIVGHYHPCVERVVAILIRSTLGWADPDTGERRLEAELALRDFLRPELSESSARTGIAGAIEAGFIIQTMEATNRQPASYALRWEDAAAQQAAIVRQRKAHGSARRRGVPVSQPGWKKRGEIRDVMVTPLSVGVLMVTPLNNRESEKKSSPEKKQSFKKGLPSASGREDVLGRLTPEQWAALEAAARARVIAETLDPIRQLTRDGKAWGPVKAMMRQILKDKGTA